jgi:hypothetical protein
VWPQENPTKPKRTGTADSFMMRGVYKTTMWHMLKGRERLWLNLLFPTLTLYIGKSLLVNSTQISLGTYITHLYSGTGMAKDLTGLFLSRRNYFVFVRLVSRGGDCLSERHPPF